MGGQIYMFVEVKDYFFILRSSGQHSKTTVKMCVINRTYPLEN